MEPAYTYIAALSDHLPEIPPDSIVSRTLHNDEHLKVTLFGFAAGQELTEHTAAQPAVLHFVEGEADLTLGKDEFQARPGSWVHMPAHLPHSLSAKTSVVMLLLLLKGGER